MIAIQVKDPMHVRAAPVLLWRSIAPAGILGSLLGVAVGWPGAGLGVPVAVGGLLYLLHDAPWKLSVLLGLSFGVGFFGVLLWWLVDSIAIGAWAGLVLVQTAWIVVFALGCRFVMGLLGGPLWVGGLWASIEIVRGQWPLGGLPWGRLGFAAVDSAWVGLLPYVGVSGTGFVLVALAASGAALARQPGRRKVGWCGVAVVASLAPVAVPFVVKEEGTWTVAVVQGGVPGLGNDVGGNHREVTRNHVEATIQLAGRVARGEVARPDVVVWPENALAVDPDTDLAARAGIEQAVGAVGVPVLVGALTEGATVKQVRNQGIVWGPDGPHPRRYTKHHPVPFGEYIPFRSLLGGLSSRFDRIPRDMVAGMGSEPLDVAGVGVADAICFDIAYDDVVGPQVRNGAQVVVVQTSNATFVGTDQPEQQFAITRARAAETGRATVVASTNGVSGVIGPTGDVVARAAREDRAVLVEEVSLSRELTPAVRWSSLWSIVPFMLAGLGFLGALARRLRCTIAVWKWESLRRKSS